MLCRTDATLLPRPASQHLSIVKAVLTHAQRTALLDVASLRLHRVYEPASMQARPDDGRPAASSRPFSHCTHPLHSRGAVHAAEVVKQERLPVQNARPPPTAKRSGRAPASGERWDASTEVPSERGFAAWPQTAHHVSWRGVDHEGRDEHHSAGPLDTESLTQHSDLPPGMGGQQADLRGRQVNAAMKRACRCLRA